MLNAKILILRVMYEKIIISLLHFSGEEQYKRVTTRNNEYMLWHSMKKLEHLSCHLRLTAESLPCLLGFLVLFFRLSINYFKRFNRHFDSTCSMGGIGNYLNTLRINVEISLQNAFKLSFCIIFPMT